MAQSRYRSRKNIQISDQIGKAMEKAAVPYILAVLFFLTVLASYGFYDAKLKWITMALIGIALVIGTLRFTALRERFALPMCALTLYVLTDALSTLYAARTASGKLALYAFLAVLSSYCLTLFLTALAPGEGQTAGRWMATALSAFAAVAGLVSIDLFSTRLISSPILACLGAISPGYEGLSGVEVGVRMTSIFGNPNVFAGVVGLGVLLALGLAATEEGKGRRCACLVLLYVNSLAFVLAFSMGGTGMIVLAFLVFLSLERKERRMGTLVLMLETLVLTMISAALVSMTSFTAWTGMRPIPLLCAIAGSAALCLLDRFAGRALADKLSGNTKLVPIVTAVVMCVIAIYAAAALNWTGGVTLGPNQRLRRAAYPEPGGYTLSVEADGPLSVTVESQNQQETMMHTSTVLYRGSAAEAAFTVPEDSLVVYFNFFAAQETRVNAASYTGSPGSGSLPLDYKLLPGFIANRLQGLFANENAIQRLVFFEDGMKLFRRSPVIGLGLSGFENSFRGVQSFWYETQYVHNHYIEVLVDKGIVGLVVFLALIGVSAAAVWFERRKGTESCPLVPALGAAVAFMAGHGAVEIVFSSSYYLPIAFGVFALIGVCCGKALPVLRAGKRAGTALVSVTGTLLVIFGCLLGGNLMAAHIADTGRTLSDLTAAIQLDAFEWSDYANSYIYSAQHINVTDSIRQQADAYAERLSGIESVTVAFAPARYYFSAGRVEDAFDAMEQDVHRFASDPNAWQLAFELLREYEADTAEFRAGASRIVAVLEEWNTENMGEIPLTEDGWAFIRRITGRET